MSHNNLSDLILSEWDIVESSYLGYSSFDDGDLLELSAIFENDRGYLIAHTRFGFLR